MNSTTTMMANVMEKWDNDDSEFDVDDFMSLMDASNQVKNSY